MRIYKNSIYIWETDDSVPLTSPEKISPIGQRVPKVPMWNTWMELWIVFSKHSVDIGFFYFKTVFALALMLYGSVTTC